MSTGLSRYTSIEYSTLPAALRGAEARSVIVAFSGSLGSISPNARPASFSYGPIVPKNVPPKVGDWTVESPSFVIRASAGGLAARYAAARTRVASREVFEAVGIVARGLPCSVDSSQRSRGSLPDLHPEQRLRLAVGSVVQHEGSRLR